MPDPHQITQPKQLLVEGRDAECFFYPFLDHIGLADVQIQNFGGIADLASGWLRQFVINSRFKRGFVESIGVIRDVETQPDAAFASVCNTLGAEELSQPPRVGQFAGSDPQVGVFLLPDASTQDGMLETLLLRAVADEPAMECVHQFIDCVAGHMGSCPSPVDKAKTIAYLASRPVIKQPLVGPTAQAGYWNFDHPAYDELKAFLQAL